MKLTLEKINISLLLLFITSLIFKKGDVYSAWSSQFSKALLVVLVVSTVIYVLKEHRTAQFFAILPKKIWVTLIVLLGSVLVGWLCTLVFRSIPLNFEMVSQFIALMTAVTIFLIVSFYSRIPLVKEKIMYALALPVFYVIFIIFPQLAEIIGFAREGRFFGYSDNQNVIAKILLVPAMFFISKTISGRNNSLTSFGYFLTASLSTSLIFWTGSRGALLALVLGTMGVIAVYVSQKCSWKRFFQVSGIVILIFCLGFVTTPSIGKKVIVDRVLNKDTAQLSAHDLSRQSLKSIVTKSIKSTDLTPSADAPETRYDIWSFYIMQALRNPFGFGPAFNTYLQPYVSAYQTFIDGGAHSSYLEIWLWGGIIGLACFLYLLWAAYSRLRQIAQRSDDVFTLGLFGIFITLTIAIAFDSNSRLYLFWIFLALAITYENNR